MQIIYKIKIKNLNAIIHFNKDLGFKSKTKEFELVKIKTHIVRHSRIEISRSKVIVVETVITFLV
jgi:hypothetical protein